MAGTITSNNAVLMLAVAGLFAVPQQIQGFSADDVFDTEDVEPAEIQMGVDGHMTAGFVFVPVKQGITLMADSASNDFFEAIYRAQVAAREVYYLSGSVYIPATSKNYTMTRGVMSGYKPMPDAKKVLQPRKFGLTWERVSPAVA